MSGMKPINVEKLMNHSTGISDNYYRITEAELLEDYLKAVDLLTINSDELILQKQVSEKKRVRTVNISLKQNCKKRRIRSML